MTIIFDEYYTDRQTNSKTDRQKYRHGKRLSNLTNRQYAEMNRQPPMVFLRTDRFNQRR